MHESDFHTHDFWQHASLHESESESDVTWHVAKYGYPYSEFVLCI